MSTHDGLRELNLNPSAITWNSGVVTRTLVVGAPAKSVGEIAFCCVLEGWPPLVVQQEKSRAPLQSLQLDGADGVEDRPLKLRRFRWRRRSAAMSCLPLRPLLLSCLSTVQSLLAQHLPIRFQ
jgi:hypothetical protein